MTDLAPNDRALERLVAATYALLADATGLLYDKPITCPPIHPYEHPNYLHNQLVNLI